MLIATTVRAPLALLHDLLHVCRVAARLIDRVAARCGNERLRRHCRALARVYAAAARELREALAHLPGGGDGPPVIPHLRTMLVDDPYAACLRIEGHVVTVFRDALDARPPAALGRLLQRRFEQVLGALDELARARLAAD